MKHLKVPKERASEVIRKVREKGLQARNYGVFNDGTYVYVPLEGEGSIWDSEVVDIEGRPEKRGETPVRVSGSFDAIGTIAVIKARDMEKASAMADSILKGGSGIRSVYMDTGISGEYRLRNLILVAGEENRTSLYRENGVTLKVDLEKVYFSPRLATERMILSKHVAEDEKILDMFCGVGPFSIVIARKQKCNIVALDKNPFAIELLRENIAMNRLAGTVIPVCGDASEYVKSISGMDRVIMNLPENSGSFLSLASGAVRRGGLINYYENLDVTSLEQRMEEIVGMGLEIVSKREVHTLSRTESMYSLELKKT